MKIGGKEKIIRLNKHLVSVRVPKKRVSFEKGMKELNKSIEKIKKQKI